MKEKMKIMIVDDETVIRESFLLWFEKMGHDVETAASGPAALQHLEKAPFDLLFVDIKMPGMDGIELLGRVRADYPDTFVIIITAYGSIESAVAAMKQGAVDYLLKPFKPGQLTLVLEKVLQQKRLTSQRDYLKSHLEKITRFDNIIGRSPAMEKIFAMIPEVAASDASLLLLGETGTGKELVAKAVHARSRRAHLPFVPINCGAIPDSLLESELFGHRKGAFTGALHSRKGFLEVVCGGTLFLDEIGEISLKMQIDLLRVLEEKKILRIGNSHPVDVDFRLISATSRDLEEKRAAAGFRQDFYYRINVIHLQIPPLRRRREDIPLLAAHFLEKYSQETNKHVDRIDGQALQALTAYPWPGNVRELENAVERAVVLARSRTLGRSDFGFLQGAPAVPAGRTLREVEIAHLRRTLAECAGNVSRAARVLDINRATLHKKINRYGLRPAT